jgi:hypothetical protein
MVLLLSALDCSRRDLRLLRVHISVGRSNTEEDLLVQSFVVAHDQAVLIDEARSTKRLLLSDDEGLDLLVSGVFRDFKTSNFSVLQD